MTEVRTDPIDQFLSELRAVGPRAAPVLTATFDLGVGGSGRPTALRVLRQALREAVDRYVAATDNPEPRSFDLDDEVEAVETVIAEATAQGAAGVLYTGTLGGGFLRTLETAYPFRNAVDVDDAPCLFELLRYRHLAGGGAVLASISLREVEITGVRYGVVEATDSVEPPTRIEKLKQRTNREGFGSADGAGGHALNRVVQHIYAQRLLYANDAADRIASMVEPGDMLVLAGVESGRGAIHRQLPESLAAEVVQSPALDPTQDERARVTWLTELVVESRYEAGDRAAAEWFDNEWTDLTAGGIASAEAFAEQARLRTLLLHEDAVDHFGTAADARDRVPEHDSHRVEALVRSALDQGAEIVITRDARALEQHEGVLAIARY